MKWILSFILLVMGLSTYSLYRLKDKPVELYEKWIRADFDNYYKIENFKKEFLKPQAEKKLSKEKEDFQQLWREFAIGHTKIPLPYRHPLYNTIPQVGYTQKEINFFGINITNPEKRQLTKVLMFKPYGLIDISSKQQVYRLPFVRNRIAKIEITKLWKDLFSKDVTLKPSTLDEMIYNLFLLDLRHHFFPSTTKSFSFLNDQNKGVIELYSPNKDYAVEMILEFRKDQVFNYLITTDNYNSESKKLRDKFIDTIAFNLIDPQLAVLLQTEFKQLNYNRQIDQDGMLLLFSAWTQNSKNSDYLREMIFYLERGRDKSEFLKVLYKTSFDLFGKTFATKDVFLSEQDQNISLQAKIEIEAQKKQRELEEKTEEIKPQPELTPDEKLDLYLKKAKENKPKGKEEISVH